MKKSKSHPPRRISEQVSIQTCLHADTRRQVPEGGKTMTDPQYRRNEPAMTCVFCHNQETYWSAAHGTGNSEKKRVYKPEAKLDFFICSACVQKLLKMDQAQLRAACALAETRGFTLKTQALRSFMEDNNEQRSPKSRKLNHRSRPLRTIRMRQKTTCTPKAQRRSAFYRHYKDKQTLSRV
ncbi:MAG: hypothetical protein KAV83_04875 [Desulfobacterales bacterium]|nr:hypothetical protein [Desulfobacterales bacterium]